MQDIGTQPPCVHFKAVDSSRRSSESDKWSREQDAETEKIPFTF